ncbi:hypothetical protein HanPSC8_Chr10g0427631 [Helianthus annuus]|nr:hypothetical protein HanPSC8_Chr10g0427631 [Helianthus annuus]
MEITLIYHPLHCSPIFTSSRAHTRYKLSPKILLKFASILVQNKVFTNEDEIYQDLSSKSSMATC